MDPTDSADTRRICERLSTEAREARISTLHFAVGLAMVVTGLVVFACALILF